MNRVVYTGKGVCEIESQVLTELEAQEVRIEVAFASVSTLDMRLVAGELDVSADVPVVPGQEMGGTIVEVGARVADLKVGDRVVVRSIIPCGNCPACESDLAHTCHHVSVYGVDAPGCWQSMWTVAAAAVHVLPDEVTLRHGAWVGSVAVACHAVRRAQVKPGEYVVVMGAGPIGLLLACVAQNVGAHVVVVETNAFRRGLAAGIGFDVLDPTTVDMEELVRSETTGAGADVVFEATGSAAGAAAMVLPSCVRGRVVVVGDVIEPAAIDLHQVMWRELSVTGSRGYETEDFEQAIEWIGQSQLPLSRLVSGCIELHDLPRVMAALDPAADRMKVLVAVKAL